MIILERNNPCVPLSFAGTLTVTRSSELFAKFLFTSEACKLLSPFLATTTQRQPPRRIGTVGVNAALRLLVRKPANIRRHPRRRTGNRKDSSQEKNLFVKVPLFLRDGTRNRPTGHLHRKVNLSTKTPQNVPW